MTHSDLNELCMSEISAIVRMMAKVTAADVVVFQSSSRLSRSFTMLEDSFNVNRTNKSASDSICFISIY